MVFLPIRSVLGPGVLGAIIVSLADMIVGEGATLICLG